MLSERLRLAIEFARFVNISIGGNLPRLMQVFQRQHIVFNIQ